MPAVVSTNSYVTTFQGYAERLTYSMYIPLPIPPGFPVIRTWGKVNFQLSAP